MTDKHSKLAYATMRRTAAIEGGCRTLKHAATMLRKAAERMDSYADRLGEPAETNPSPILNWAINHLACNVLNNCRLDLMASDAADIVAAEAVILTA